jgi:hypothetical protein
MSELAGFITDGLIAGGIGYVIVKNQETFGIWLHKKLLHGESNNNVSQNSALKALRTQAYELNEILHQQKMSEEEAKLAISRAKLEIIKRQTEAHIEAATKQLALAASNPESDAP